MPIDLPKRFTQAWIEGHVPGLSRLDADVVLAAMRAKGWTEVELEARVYPYLHTPVRPPQASPAVPETDPGRPKPASRIRRIKRLSLTECGALAGVIGSAAAVVALFAPFDHGASGPPTPNAPAATRSIVPASTDAQRALQALIPAAVSQCKADNDLRKTFGAVAAIRCSLGKAAVGYLSFATVPDMYNAYEPTAHAVSGGNCAKAWNVDSSYRAGSPPTDVGSIKCYTDSGTAWIEWTRVDERVYSFISRPDGNQRALYAAWTKAGPKSPA